MISFIPLCCHPNPEKVLIVGGGDGGLILLSYRFSKFYHFCYHKKLKKKHIEHFERFDMSVKRLIVFFVVVQSSKNNQNDN